MTATDLDQMMIKRRGTVASDGFSILDSHGCPETGGGVVLGERNWGRREVRAHYFKPRTHRRVFETEEITSNHQKVALPGRVKVLLDRMKAAKVAPHDLEIGQIVANIWGVTMQDVRFYKVSEVPHPRKVRLAPIESRIVSGDWMAGEKAPVDREVSPSEGSVYMVDMSGGSALVKIGSSIDRCRPWDGRPVSICSD